MKDDNKDLLLGTICHLMTMSKLLLKFNDDPYLNIVKTVVFCRSVNEDSSNLDKAKFEIIDTKKDIYLMWLTEILEIIDNFDEKEKQENSFLIDFADEMFRFMMELSPHAIMPLVTMDRSLDNPNIETIKYSTDSIENITVKINSKDPFVSRNSQ